MFARRRGSERGLVSRDEVNEGDELVMREQADGGATSW